jgi:hypothetical protein
METRKNKLGETGSQPVVRIVKHSHRWDKIWWQNLEFYHLCASKQTWLDWSSLEWPISGCSA